MSLLAQLESAVKRLDYDQAGALFDRLRKEQPDVAAEIIVRLRLSDKDARAIGAA